jgi:hypothetical protein
MKTHPRTLAALGAVVALVIVGAIVFASIPAPDGLISGCYSNNGGRLRVIDAATQKCLNSETPLAWNARGLQGLKGDPGMNGLNGTNGTNGLNGVSVTSQALPLGDAHCPNGGSKFTSASGDTYACNGAAGGSAGSLSFNTRVAIGSPFSIDLDDGLLFNGGCGGEGANTMELNSTIGVNTFIAGGFRQGTDFTPLLQTYGNIFMQVTGAGSFDVVWAMGFPNVNLGHFRRVAVAMFPDASGCRYVGTSDPAGQ